MQVYYDKDAELNFIKDKKIAVIGFGSQGHAQAMNLADSGCDVVVGLKPTSKSVEKAKNAGLRVTSVSEAAAEAQIVMILVPDELAKGIYEAEIAAAMTPGKYLAFSHGFSIHFGFIKPPAGVNVFMVAPKGPGHLVRSQFSQGAGVPCFCSRCISDPERRLEENRLGVCQRDWRRARGCDRDDFPRRNGNRFVRRAVGAVRRTFRADYRWIRKRWWKLDTRRRWLILSAATK